MKKFCNSCLTLIQKHAFEKLTLLSLCIQMYTALLPVQGYAHDKLGTNHMRELSPTFLTCMKSGFLSGITECVRRDHDLNLEIRDSYINVYYKGNSLLKLTDTGSLTCYKAELNSKFLDGLNLSLELTEDTVDQFIASIPMIKENIVRCGKRSLELEYEQMIVRANNFEPRNNTEYFIVDRQYSKKEGRFDLTGIYWSRNGRRRNQKCQSA
jgi:hypothetical protein